MVLCSEVDPLPPKNQRLWPTTNMSRQHGLSFINRAMREVSRKALQGQSWLEEMHACMRENSVRPSYATRPGSQGRKSVQQGTRKKETHVKLSHLAHLYSNVCSYEQSWEKHSAKAHATRHRENTPLYPYKYSMPLRRSRYSCSHSSGFCAPHPL